MVDPILLYAAAASLSGILLLGALDKLRDIARFEAAVGAYALLPGSLVGGFSWLFAFAELGAGIMLLFPFSRGLGSTLGLVVLLAATAGIAVNLLRGRRDIDCGCGGLGGQDSGLSWWLVTRNAMLIALLGVVFLAFDTAPRALNWIDGLTFFGATLAVLGLYFSFNQLIDSHNRFQKT